MSVKQILSDLGIDYAQSGDNIGVGWVGLDCPFCGDDENHLGVNKTGGYFSCWKCGETGSFKYLLSVLLQKSMWEVKEILAEYDFLPVTEIKEHAQKIELKNIGVWNDVYLRYLKDRGFNSISISKYGLLPFNTYGPYAWRIMIPVYYEKQMVCFTTRSVREMDLPYINCSDEKAVMSIKDTLFNIDSVKDVAVIVEGPFDAMNVGDGCVATFGIQWTPAQINLLRKKKVKQCYVLYDNEDKAQKQAEYMADQIYAFSNVEILQITDVKDPGELSKEKVLELRRNLFLV